MGGPKTEEGGKQWGLRLMEPHMDKRGLDPECSGSPQGLEAVAALRAALEGLQDVHFRTILLLFREWRGKV